VELPLNFRSVIGLATLNSSVSNAAEDQIVGILQIVPGALTKMYRS